MGFNQFMRQDMVGQLETDIYAIHHKGEHKFVTLPYKTFADIQAVIDIIGELQNHDYSMERIRKLGKRSPLGQRFVALMEKHEISLRERQEKWLIENLQSMIGSLE